MEKVESMQTLPELDRIGMCVMSFSNLKRPQDMKRVMLTLSIVTSDGKILESHDCREIETRLEDGMYKTFGAEIIFASKMKDIPRNSAFILELKHYKDKYDKLSTKCWSYIETDNLAKVLSSEGKTKVHLPLGAKPMDPTRRTWVNYDWLTRGIKTFQGKVDGAKSRSLQYEHGVIVGFVLKSANDDCFF